MLTLSILLVGKFFTPSKQIISLKEELLQTYAINLETNQYCGIYYRGSDKYKETKLAPFKEYAKRVDSLYEENNKLIFIIFHGNIKTYPQ